MIAHNGQVSNLDAMDITAPYTAGALRGGTHVHVFTRTAVPVSFTYNDHVLHARDPQLDLRNVGVAALSPVTRGTIRGNMPEPSGAYW